MLVTDGYDYPMGATAIERQGAACPAGWRVALGYGAYYLLLGNPTIHTGLDVVYQDGGGYGTPFYAPANGVVIFAQDVTTSSWRLLLVLEHTEPDGSKTYTRFGHLKDVTVSAGDIVMRGQLIGHEGNANGLFAAHHHLDVSRDAILKTRPTYWPGNDYAAVQQYFVDPLQWLKEHRPMSAIADQIKALAQQIEVLTDQIEPPAPPPVRATVMKYVTAQPSVNVRATPSTAITTNIVGKLTFQTAVLVYADQPDPAWRQISAGNGQYPDCYLAAQWLSAERP